MGEDCIKGKCEKTSGRTSPAPAQKGSGGGKFFPPAAIQRQPCDTPYDKANQAQAKKKLEILKPRLAALLAQKGVAGAEKVQTLYDRKTLDATGTNKDKTAERQEREEQNLQSLNRKPVSISVSGDSIAFRVKFQVLFADPAMKGKFDLLKTTLQKGIDLVWNQVIQKGALGGRKFTVVPEIVLIDSPAKRSDEYWLIEIRSSDTAPVTHPGCKLDQPPPGAPTSVTDPLCDNGVMSIPPLHIANAGVLGHEMLHLFGLVDRYIQLTYFNKGSKPTFELIPDRETGGRKDALGGDDGPVLSEDLGFLFNKFGVYDKVLAPIDQQIAVLTPMVARLQEIADTGCDPNSLLPVRKDFNDKMIKDAEDN